MDLSFPGLTCIHESPQIFVIDDFLPECECIKLIAMAEPHVRASGTAFGGASNAANVRTSSTVLLHRQRAEVRTLHSRIGALLGKPPEHMEDPQVSRYNKGEFYLCHWDGPPRSEPTSEQFLASGGQRLATVLFYLNTVPSGGATAFPLLNLEVTPKRGRALVFFPGRKDGSIDEMLLHEAKPTGEQKWVAQVWVRQSADLRRAFMDTPESV
jgi:prolyl 4-hydroxylase